MSVLHIRTIVFMSTVHVIVSLVISHNCSAAGLQEQSSVAARAKKDAAAAQKRAARAEAETTALKGRIQQQSLATGSGPQQAEVAPLRQPLQAAQVPGMLTACTNKAHSWACRDLCLCTVSVGLCLCVHTPLCVCVCTRDKHGLHHDRVALCIKCHVMSCLIPGGRSCDECRQRHLLGPILPPPPPPPLFKSQTSLPTYVPSVYQTRYACWRPITPTAHQDETRCV